MTIGGRVRPGLGPFPGAGSTAEQNQLLGEPQLLAAKLFFQVLPDRIEDKLGVLDLQVERGTFVSGGGRHGNDDLGR